jgi:hypothetical protein
MATMLYTKFVGLTAGLVKLRMLTWKGRSKKAPDTPPMEVKVDTTKATRAGMSGLTSTPETGKSITHLYLAKTFTIIGLIIPKCQ